MGWPNLSRETKFSGANGDRQKNNFPCSADHEQDWQPYTVDPYSAVSGGYTYAHTYNLINIQHVFRLSFPDCFLPLLVVREISCDICATPYAPTNFRLISYFLPTTEGTTVVVSGKYQMAVGKWQKKEELILLLKPLQYTRVSI